MSLAHDPILLRPLGAQWQVWEGEMVCPRFLKYEHAEGYAKFRATDLPREIHVLDGRGKVVRVLQAPKRLARPAGEFTPPAP